MCRDKVVIFGKRTVALITHSYDVGGVSLRVRSIVEAYKELGYKIIVIVMRFSGEPFKLSIYRMKDSIIVVELLIPCLLLIILDAIERLFSIFKVRSMSLFDRLKYVISRFSYMLPLTLLSIISLWNLRRIRKLLTRVFRYVDIVQLETLLTASLVTRLLGESKRNIENLTLIYDAHNVEIAVASKKFFWRLLNGIIFHSERHSVSKADIVFVPTQIDKDMMTIYYSVNRSKIHVLPNALPQEYLLLYKRLVRGRRYIEIDSGEMEEVKLAFIGRMDYLPNKEAYDWILKKFAYELSRKLTDLPVETKIKIYVAGRKVPRRVICVSHKVKIYSLGEIRNGLDMALINRSDIALIPLRYGGGSKYKTILALVFGKPLLSTLEGVRGLELEKILEFSIVVLNEKRDKIVDKLIELLVDPQKFSSMKLIARRNSSYFAKKYCIYTVLNVIKNTLGVLGSKR